MEEIMAIARKHNLYVMKICTGNRMRLYFSDGTTKKTGTIGHTVLHHFIRLKTLALWVTVVLCLPTTKRLQIK
jgi:hypothetical protein